jgi:hypothetical protein
MSKEPLPGGQPQGAAPVPKVGARPSPKGAAGASAAAQKGGGVEEVKGARATGVREELEEQKELGLGGLWAREALKNTPSWLISMVFHMIVLLVLALWVVPLPLADEFRQLVVAPGEEEVDELEELTEEPLDDTELVEATDEVATQVVSVESPVEQETMNISPAADVDAANMSVELSDFGLERAPKGDLLATVGSFTGTGVAGRGSGSRGKLVKKYGGSAGSEASVAAALEWLAMHQCRDGGWSFDLRTAPACQGKCRNSGELGDSRCAATGLALLPFLGAGQTHKEGKYKTAVNNGLNFLCTRMKVSPQGASMWENGGRMYAHGIGSIAVCEAYAMTHDKRLHNPAQGAINFICYAQDPVAGGWRYSPREKGDTSVVGWQIMALKSGHMAYLRVPPEVVKKAFGYLDTVQADSGAQYGYTGPGTGPATTAIGLLCRMYLGWKKDNPALERGVQQISKMGPNLGNMYYNYYATQVCRHWEGDVWKKWNGVMRDQLVNSQAKEGCEKGSWYMGAGDSRGGRLYCTAMATMVLEVYYRHLPIYGSRSTEEDFPE